MLALTGAAATADEPLPKTSQVAKADTPSGHPYEPSVAEASPDASQAMKKFRLPQGLKAELYASEPLLANPVAFGFDEKGRVYVVETFRLHHGVTDTRGHMNWLDDDLASRTIDDRVAKYRKYLGKEAESYGKEHDRLRLVEDRDGDGKADHATVFADGFNHIPDGLGAGVLARKGDVYFTCIPDLWLLRDTDGDGKADVKKSLHHGYGVHTGFLGHDLHGLTFGPDGRLYFSIGDRGLNVTTLDGRKLFLPDTGAVLRCEPDGTNLEFFATGLRNPQELAFDDLGNLFTVDNNSDSGDRARLVYLIEGSDSGWTMGWQYIEWPVARGPWNAEKLWVPHFKDQAAHIVPPVQNLSDGPSGLVYNPGATLLPDRYKGHFFFADFKGSAGLSGVRAFSVKPKGAGFELGDSEQFLWGLEATDVDFGPDGALYVSDWVEGWGITGKGRIYKVTDPRVSPKASVEARQTKMALARGFDGLPEGELPAYLAFPDRRVRQEAQFALAARGVKSLPALRAVALDHGPSLHARLHALWALGQIGRKAPEALESLRSLLKDSDAQVRSQAAKALGDARYSPAADGLTALLKDDNRHVRSLAAIALGKLGRPSSVAPLLDLLRTNADADPFLRHSAVMGLSGSNDTPALVRAATDSSPAARLGVLLALRRLKSPEVARFLADADPRLVTEAARAIYDAPIEPALPQLAALARSENSGLGEPAWRRIVNAAARVGGPENARALGKIAARESLPELVRVEAVRILTDWPKPPGRDRVTGLWRPTPGHPASEAAEALRPVMTELVNGRSFRVREAAIRAAGPLPLTAAQPLLNEVLADTSRPVGPRVEALKALERLGDPKLPEAVSRAVNDPEPSLRVEGRRLLAKLEPSRAISALGTVLDSGSAAERQGAFATLASMPPGAADDLLAQWLDRYKSGRVPPEVALDLLDAARQRKSEAVSSRLKSIESALPKDDPLAPYRETLVGGDAARGEKILKEKAEVQCLRCHKVRGTGGEVGPELLGVAKRGDRRYLLESIVTPNREIAKGFETLLVATTDGQVHAGILKEETATTLRLITPEAKLVTVAKADIEERKRGASAMPEDLIKQLSKPELRDLIEFLSTLK
jgi:quinoprotein glucose dehydrogenase